MPPTDRLRAALEACKVPCEHCQQRIREGHDWGFACHMHGDEYGRATLPPAVAELDAAWREQADALAAALRDLERWSRDGGQFLDGLKWDASIQQAVTKGRAALATYDAAEAKGGAR